MRFPDVVKGEKGARRIFRDCSPIFYHWAEGWLRNALKYDTILRGEGVKVKNMVESFALFSFRALHMRQMKKMHGNGYWESLKTNHTLSVYFESDKEKWLEKIRPLAKELYKREWKEDGR